jgi:hypothetical protein
VASSRERFPGWLFKVYLLSNALWIPRGTYSRSWALSALQLGFIAMNVRGPGKNKA